MYLLTYLLTYLRIVRAEKMFADSSFYEDAEQKYPTIEQQIKMARQVAHLLTSPSGPSGRGQQMFLKRQQMSDHWKHEPGTDRPVPVRGNLRAIFSLRFDGHFPAEPELARFIEAKDGRWKW